MQIVTAGCTLPHKVGISKTGIPHYDQVRIVYDRFDAQGALLKNWFEQHEETSPGDHSGTMPAEPGNTVSRVRLTIEYPLPNDTRELARATVQWIPDSPAETSESEVPRSFVGYVRNGVHKFLPGGNEANAQRAVEIGVYDFPRQELDLLLIDLVHNGFFGSQTRPGTKTSLHVQVDRGQTAKHWTPDPRLDHIIKQVDYENRRRGNSIKQQLAADSL